MGELVGALVQLPVREVFVTEDHGHRVRRLARLLREALVDGGLVGERRPRVVPVDEQLALLGFVHERQRGQGLPHVPDDGLEQRTQVPQHASDGGLVEEGRAVLGAEAQAASLLGRDQRQVEARHTAVHRQRVHAQAGKRHERQGRVLQDEHHLEQRGDVQPARRLEHLHQLLEGHVLVREGAKGGVMHLTQQLAEGRVAGQVRAQDERVDEQADEAFELGAGTARDRGADGEVVLAGVALEQDVERRQEHGEQRAALAQGHELEALDEREGQQQIVPSPPAIGLRLAWPVRGQLQHGVRIQPLPPVRQLRFERVPSHPLALPRGVVRVLQAQRCQGRGLAGREGPVQLRHLADEHTQGPAVGHDVVDRQEQQVLLLLQDQEGRAHQGAGGEREGAKGLGGGAVACLGLTLFVRQGAQVGEVQRQGRRRRDDLHGAFGRVAERGAQGLVAVHQRFEPAAQGLDVQRPGQPQGDGHVVRGRPGLQLINQPQPLLGEGQRRGLPARHWHQGRQPGRSRLRCASRVEVPREAFQRRGLEDGAQGQFHAEGRAHARDELCGKE
ncbi:hypothetical protein ASNO1_62750 [Corallococcus caeni]|uniref:Uncharacterized protein n=1 Tax=Corallococcus caeni TaxID=3082388 RepID=A0ABQ6R289_9BACT|nr:hypothetical protein ASNO1_62750 [Corallococcus sp. NO1]